MPVFWIARFTRQRHISMRLCRVHCLQQHSKIFFAVNHVFSEISAELKAIRSMEMKKWGTRDLLDPSTTRKQREKIAIYEPGRRSSPDTESSGGFILDFSASRIVRNFCVYELLRLLSSVTAAWTDQDAFFFSCYACYLLFVPNYMYSFIFL